MEPVEYHFSKESLEKPEFQQALWKQYEDLDGRQITAVHISDPFFVETTSGDIYCDSGYLGLTTTGELFPVTDEEMTKYKELS